MYLKKYFQKLFNKREDKHIPINFKILQEDKTFKEATIFLNKKIVNKQRKLTSNISVNDFEYFWELRDDLFNNVIIKSFEKQTLDFLNKVHSNDFIYTNNNDNNPIEVVDTFYHFYDDEIYFFVEPCYDLYSNDKADRLELRLLFDSSEFEKLLIKILDSWGIDYSYYEQDDYESIWDSELEMGKFFYDFITKQWKKSKAENNSDLKGFISYATGGAGYYDLDNGNSVKESVGEVRKYLEKNNIYIKSEL